MSNLIVSVDFSQIELVLIGEFSGDPVFAKAYGQLPYNDLHLDAACAVLSALKEEEISVDAFKQLQKGENPFTFELNDPKGNLLEPKAFYKMMRGTDGGKGANFEFWYSRYLANVAQRWGLSPAKTLAMVDAYIDRFAVGVAWRDSTIAQARFDGFVTLPDGHRRVKYEATPEWRAMMQCYFRDLGENLGTHNAMILDRFGYMVANKIQRRAGNQLINALIQGSCATLAKRSIISIRKAIKACGMKARFLMPIHDEVVFSVPVEEVWEFIMLVKPIMADHPTIIKNLKMTSTASVGKTFQPFDAKQAPFGQIEFDEAPNAAFIPTEYHGKALPKDAANDVIRRLAA